jgi:predicted nuclease of predicted toxin-antitoxin system
VKLWFDEDLSPTLVQVADERGFEATCNRDRAVLGYKDPQLRALVQGDGYILVTDNASDFRPIYARVEIHPGLMVMPAEFGRDRQQQFARAVIDYVVDAAAQAGETPADFMVNKLVEIDHDGACAVQDLPMS